MKVVFKQDLLILVPETEEERGRLGAWKGPRAGHVLHVAGNPGVGVSLVDRGPSEYACNEPINVISTSPVPASRLISNFAATHFRLDGRDYACIEAFWQGLKFPEGPERERVALLDGQAARATHLEQPSGATVVYEGQQVVVGTWDHWQLMDRACWAKFTQNEDARQALLSTGDRPLVHRTRRDSRTIPGVIMAEIWMRIRARLRSGERPPGENGIPADNCILFFRRDRLKFGFLSNFQPALIRLGGELWPTIEHYYQAQKSDDPAYRQAIRQAATPGEAKRLATLPGPHLLAGEGSWFVRHNAQPRPDWQEAKLGIMREAVLAKFTQNADLRSLLQATGTAELIEDSKSDSYWGMGPDGRGQNWLGRLLMEVRESLRGAEGATTDDGSED